MTVEMAMPQLQANDQLFGVGILLWLGPTIALGVWAIIAQRRYIRHYRDRHDLQPQTLPSLDAPFLTIGRMALLSERQTDPGLERARRHALRAMWLTWGYAFGCPILLAIASGTGMIFGSF